MVNKKPTSALLALIIFSLTSCTTDPYTGEKKISKTAIYGAAGATAGAIGGLLIGGDAKSALAGAAIGGAAGGGYGYYQDRQEKKLREVLAGSGVQVKKDGNNIKLIMPGNITFGSNQFDIQSSFFRTLNSIALVLKEFDKSRINVSGHTDSSGDNSKNLALAQKRADSVATYLIAQGVNSSRIDAIGYGSSQPIASNETAEGRSQNRRVEINILTNN